MAARSECRPLEVAVLVADPRLPGTFPGAARFQADQPARVRRLGTVLDGLTDYRFRLFDDHARLIDDLRAASVDLVLNFCDGGYRNDTERVSHIPSLLELLGLPYTGSPAGAMALASDKEVLHAMAINLGIPSPNETFVDLSASPLTLPRAYPALVKPKLGAGSCGMTADCVVRDAGQAEACMRWLAGQVQPPEAVIQDFLTGAEYTVGVVGNPDTGLTVLAPAEVDYSGLDPDLPPVLTAEAKFDPGSRYGRQIAHRKAELDDTTYAQLVHHSARLFRRLHLRDYARFDFRAGRDGRVRLLDANPNPGWYGDGRLAMMAAWSQYTYPDLVRMILEAAVSRYGLR